MIVLNNEVCKRNVKDSEVTLVFVQPEDCDAEKVGTNDLEVIENANEKQVSPTQVSPTQVIPQRSRQLPRKLADYEQVPDNEVGSGGEIVHLAMFANAEPVDYHVALKDKSWKKAMVEELSSI